MKHLFVPYELALLAKQKGFNEPCIASYYTNIEGLLLSQFPEDHKALFFELNSEQVKLENCAAPLYQQLVDWFREKHDRHIGVDSADITGCFGYIKTKSKTSSFYNHLWTNADGKPLKYYEALNHSLTEALKLI